MIRKHKNRYFIGVLMAILIITVNQFFIQYWLYQKKEDSKVINISGRQRMLSQKLNLEIFKLFHQQISLSDIQKTYQLWRKAHYALLNGDADLKIHAIKNEEARKMLRELSPRIDFVGRHLQDKIDLGIISQLSENQAAFLVEMDDTVKKLEQEADHKLWLIVVIEVVLALFSISIIVVEIIYIFQPIERKLLQIIKELESSERKLLAILNSSPDSNIFIGPDYKIINFNKSAEESVRLSHKLQIKIGDDFRNYLLNGMEYSFFESFREAMKGEIVGKETQMKINQKMVWFKLRYFPVYDNAQQIIGVSFNATNINERKKAEMKIKEQLSILNDIAWQQSHLVRSPVANMLGFTHLLLNKEYMISDDEKSDFIKNLEEEAQRLDKIIKEIVAKTHSVYQK
ncbi:type IV pili methyl-accepting chemotaxis transducer N-terminal domain-containing protein [Arcicella rigui]|uniref:Type IV pili methyl-accepting chemotaxis transducer N-terminal domain-containing protein n=1 Tax=Arcicella rigui TaxID=797020 RepID=A0ABU5Q5X3_9BACT|nr:type IV pili methyl-accepting chemotaxis transducer N-terminal domain-containing protein [Arcicella rigui]MEA5138236.1 type IV pili methyl-accepting chemotaxis transducer N-terminal domain-containing protein [Arcicella rigui]